MATDIVGSTGRRFKIVVATTVMLSFISFWRAAAIVLNDLGSSAFYAAGIAEQAYGKAAPWFILAVMLFANAVRMVYIESCAMFTRGGVYRVVKEAMGGTLGKLAVSALMFDYVLTGPISGVSAGQYLVGLINDTAHYFGQTWTIPRGYGAASFALVVTLYFWRNNIIGLHESSEKALRIMYLVTALVVVVLSWCAITIIFRGAAQPIPWPILANVHLTPESLGWLKSSSLPSIGAVAAMICFGHSVLAMSGEESLAQVNREIEHPKLKNLKRAGVVIGIYTFLFTAVSAFLAVVLIPDAIRARYADNLISGLAMNVAGPYQARLLFQAFVVIVGSIMLSGAVNTAIIGSNGVLNRLAEDGVLTDWFRKPHHKFGSTYRMINMVAILQVATILASRGNTLMLGEAYAFGVIWSFTLMTTSILLLRFKRPGPREWRVPLNVRIGSVDFPIGVSLIALVLFATALTNLFTKKVATVSGIAFTAVLFTVFTVSERVTARRRAAAVGIEQFNITANENVNCELVGCRPGNVLAAVRDANSLAHLRVVLERTNTDEQDIVVMTSRLMTGPDFAEQLSVEQQALGEYEQSLFTSVVNMAEKMGKPVALTVVPGTNPEEAIMVTAQRLRSAVVVVGRSPVMSPAEKGRMIGLAWERLPHPRPRLTLQVIGPRGEIDSFVLGPHTPQLRPEDVETLHRIWLELSNDPTLRNLHHNQIMTVALRRLAVSLRSDQRESILAELRRIAAGTPRLPHS